MIQIPNPDEIAAKLGIHIDPDLEEGNTKRHTIRSLHVHRKDTGKAIYHVLAKMPSLLERKRISKCRAIRLEWEPTDKPNGDQGYVALVLVCPNIPHRRPA